MLKPARARIMRAVLTDHHIFIMPAINKNIQVLQARIELVERVDIIVIRMARRVEDVSDITFELPEYETITMFLNHWVLVCRTLVSELSQLNPEAGSKVIRAIQEVFNAQYKYVTDVLNKDDNHADVEKSMRLAT